MQNTCLRTSAPNDGDVAQLGEHHVRNVGVVGSNPIISTTSLPQVRGLMASGLFSFLNLLSIAECANRVQTARGYAVLTIRRRGLSSFSPLSANSSPSMSAALRSFCGMAWAYQLSVRLALLWPMRV